MSARLISVVVAFGVLTFVAVALTVTPPYPTKADFDWAFAQLVTASTFDPEGIVADRERIRMAGLRQVGARSE
jgi:hypothetical protein